MAIKGEAICNTHHAISLERLAVEEIQMWCPDFQPINNFFFIKKVY